jgi:hypothetical protein
VKSLSGKWLAEHIGVVGCAGIFYGNRNLMTPIKSRTLHLTKQYDTQPTPHTEMQPRGKEI